MTVMTMLFSWIRARIRQKGHMVDGPGMVNEPKWVSFTISRSDSYAQNNFSFTVADDGMKAFVTGTCRDDEGTTYEMEDGIAISAHSLRSLREMGLEDLAEVTVDVNQGDLMILDGSVVTLTLQYAVGPEERKRASKTLSMEMFRILSPYLINGNA